MGSSSQGFAVDRTGIALIVVIAVVVTPAAMFASAWVVTGGLDFAAASTFDLVIGALACLLALFTIRVTARELAGALRVRIDERCLTWGNVELAWDEVETLATPTFGLLELAGNGKRVLLRTYLYDDRAKLLEFIAQRTGKQVPEHPRL